MKSLFDESKIGVDDLIYLNQLLSSDISFQHALDLLENKKNKKIFDDIKNRLSKGELIENIIITYLPKTISSYMDPLLKTLSFQMSLDLALQFYQKHKSSTDSLVSKIAYPCILLFVTITALYLFDLYGLDSIFSIVSSFDQEIKLYSNIRVLFRILITSIYYFMLLIILVVIYFSRPSKLAYLYLFLSKHFPNSLIATYYSEEFVSLLLICVKRGYGSKNSIEILKKMKNKPVISLMAFHLEDSLLKGNTLNEAVKQKYFDNSLSRFIKIANFSKDFETILMSFIDLSRIKINHKMKQYSQTIQLFTYSFIGIIIIFIYQILFMPMQAINGF